MLRYAARWAVAVLTGIFIFSGTGAVAAEPAVIDVEVRGAPESGTLVFELYDSPNTFGDLRDPAVRTVRSVSDGPRFVLEGNAPGDYALAVFFDANGNGRLDRNFIGIPVEPVGFSNSYRPKGPPSWKRARFALAGGGEKKVTVLLEKPLGERGQLGVGVGALVSTSPYRGDSGGTVRILPALSFMGERLQIFGLRLQVGLFGGEKLSLALSAQPRFGAYGEDDSPVLEGLGDRKDTALAGPAVQLELPLGIELSASYEHDILDRIGGGAWRVGIDKSFQVGVVRLTPEAALVRLGAELARHDYGVPPESSTADRPAYDPGAALSGEVGLSAFVELSRNWLIIVRGGAELLDDSATDSPLVDESEIYRAFGALTYAF